MMNKIESGTSFIESSFLSADVFYGKAVNVANHYGFVPFEDLFCSSKEQVKIPGFKVSEGKIDALNGEFARTIKTCIENNLVDRAHASFFYYSTLDGKAPQKAASFGLEIVGSSQSIAEAVILKTAHSILKDLGTTDARVHINSIGDRDSSARYIKELILFFRKNISSLSPNAQVIFKRGPFHALEYIKRKDDELYENVPKSIDFLSRDSRRHFREVLEYLESTEIPYTVDDRVSGNRDCYSQTLFEIKRDADDEKKEVEPLAKGGRHDELARKLFKKAAPAVGLIFSLLKKGKKKITKPRIKKKKIYLVHIGPEARKKSLIIVDNLRKSKITLAHIFSAEQLSEQLDDAKELGVHHAIIIGQKESMDDTAIVRNMETRAQETVPLSSLDQFLKQLK